MEGTSQGGGQEGGHRQQRRALYQRPPYGSLPKVEPYHERDGVFYFSFQFPLLNGEGEEGEGWGQPGALLCSPAQGSWLLLCSSRLEPSPHIKKGSSATVWPRAG